MSILIPGLSSDFKVPGVFLNVVLGGTGTSAGQPTKKILLAGNKITANLTGSAPSFTVTAGTQANAAPVKVTNADEAATYFGSGSELHLMTRAVFEQYPAADVTCVAVAEAGTAATGVATFATTATAAFTVRVTINGEVMNVAVATGDTATVIATAVATAILNKPELPVTAQFNVGAVTITPKHTGVRGNDIAVRFQFVSSAGALTEITTSSTTSPGATTCILSSVTTTESTYTLSTGATQDTVTAALASVASVKYARQAWASIDATALTAINAQLVSMASPTEQKLQQAIVCTRASLGTATTLATGQNAARMQIVWHYNSVNTQYEIAAQVAAGRLNGDVMAGGTLAGELGRPSANLDGLRLVRVREQPFVAEQPTITEQQSALSNGLTPLVPSADRPGFAAIGRSITSRSLKLAQPNYAVLDTGSVSVPDDIADDLRSYLSTELAGTNLVSEPEDDAPPQIANVVTPSSVRIMIKGRLKFRESQGWIHRVDIHDSELIVLENLDSPGRLDCEIPCVPLPATHQLGANVRQLTR